MYFELNKQRLLNDEIQEKNEKIGELNREIRELKVRLEASDKQIREMQSTPVMPQKLQTEYDHLKSRNRDFAEQIKLNVKLS